MDSSGTCPFESNGSTVEARAKGLYCPATLAKRMDVITWAHDLSKRHPLAAQQYQKLDFVDLTHLRHDVAKITGRRTTRSVDHFQSAFRVEWHPTIFPKANLPLLSKAIVHGRSVFDYVAGIQPCEDNPDFGDDPDGILIQWMDEWVSADAMTLDDELPVFWKTFAADFYGGCQVPLTFPLHCVLSGLTGW